jgi:hypothetical protein
MADAGRKTRTREHVIADLSVNVVERNVLLAGFTLSRVVPDYGFDTSMTTFSPAGEVENETVWFQMKATDHPSPTADGQFVRVRVEAADLRYWLLELMPVILVLYDAAGDRAFWVDVQRYAEQTDLDADEVGGTVTIRIPAGSVLTPDAVRQIRDRKEQVRAESARRRGSGGNS